MKKIKKIFLIILLSFISINVKADSGLDAKYDSSSSSDIIGSLFSLISPLLKILVIQPSEADYKIAHIIVGVSCIIIFYIFTNIYIFKLNNKKRKKLTILGINLIPTLIFTLFCLLTKLQLIFYIFILIIYIIILKIVTKKIIKKILKKKMNKSLEIDKDFNIDKLNEETFSIYKKVQLAWMNFKLDDVKELVSEKIYNKYQEQLDKLRKDNQKNIMDQIEFKSNKIVDIEIENNIEMIECKMNVTCYDYIIDDKENVVKGKKDKKHNFTYKLVFNKDLKTNRYILVEKKMLKQK